MHLRNLPEKFNCFIIADGSDGIEQALDSISLALGKAVEKGYQGSQRL